MRIFCCPGPPFGSPLAHFKFPAGLVMYAVDSVPSPSPVRAHRKFVLAQEMEPPPHPGDKVAPVHIPAGPPKALPPQILAGMLDVIKAYSSSECTDARQEAAPGKPDPVKAAQPAKAVG
jgi:hypothetical protein